MYGCVSVSRICNDRWQIKASKGKDGVESSGGWRSLKSKKILGHFASILRDQTQDNDAPLALLRRFGSEGGNILLVCDITHIKFVLIAQFFVQHVQSVFATSWTHDGYASETHI